MAKKVIITLTFALMLLPCLFATYTKTQTTPFQIRWTVVNGGVDPYLEILNYEGSVVIANPDDEVFGITATNSAQGVCIARVTTNKQTTCILSCSATPFYKKGDQSKTPKFGYTLTFSLSGEDDEVFTIGMQSIPKSTVYSLSFPGGMVSELIYVTATLSNLSGSGSYESTVVLELSGQ